MATSGIMQSALWLERKTLAGNNEDIRSQRLGYKLTKNEIKKEESLIITTFVFPWSSGDSSRLAFWL